MYERDIVRFLRELIDNHDIVTVVSSRFFGMHTGRVKRKTMYVSQFMSLNNCLIRCMRPAFLRIMSSGAQIGQS